MQYIHTTYLLLYITLLHLKCFQLFSSEFHSKKQIAAEFCSISVGILAGKNSQLNPIISLLLDVTHEVMLITPESTSVLECTEASQTFSDKPLEGSKHYADLYTLALDICKEDVHQQMAKAKAVFVNSVYEFLTTCKVLSYA